MLGGMWHNIDESANLYSHIGKQYDRFIENWASRESINLKTQ